MPFVRRCGYLRSANENSPVGDTGDARLICGYRFAARAPATGPQRPVRSGPSFPAPANENMPHAASDIWTGHCEVVDLLGSWGKTTINGAAHRIDTLHALPHRRCSAVSLMLHDTKGVLCATVELPLSQLGKMLKAYEATHANPRMRTVASQASQLGVDTIRACCEAAGVGISREMGFDIFSGLIDHFAAVQRPGVAR